MIRIVGRFSGEQHHFRSGNVTVTFGTLIEDEANRQNLTCQGSKHFEGLCSNCCDWVSFLHRFSDLVELLRDPLLMMTKYTFDD